MTREEMQKSIFESEKARFIDECELQMASEILSAISIDDLKELTQKLKLFSTPKNPSGFYASREIAQILSEIIYAKAEFLAKNARLKNFKGSDEGGYFILREYFLRMSFEALPAWFVEFARSYKEGKASQESAKGKSYA